jgi:glucose-6-phosphate isomerase
MSWPPELWLEHAQLGMVVDLTFAGLRPDDVAALPLSAALAEMAALEAGGLANVDEHRQVGHYWLRAPERAPTLGQAEAIGRAQQEVSDWVQRIRSGAVLSPEGRPFTDVILVGIGGSALGPLLLVDALAAPDGLAFTLMDNTDPDGIARQLGRLGDRLLTSLVLVVSKSGGTPETHNAYVLVRRALARRGAEPAGRVVVITQVGSQLAELARHERHLAALPLWDWVGGRFSISSAVGLLPAGLAGVDIASFLAGAAAMDEWTRSPHPLRNPAALLAGALYLLGSGRGDRALVVLPYSDRLVVFSRYLQQLVMESLGKRVDRQGAVVHQGLTVFGNKGSTDQHAFVQQLRDGRSDFVALFVQVLGDGLGDREPVAKGGNAGDYLQGFLLGTRRALRDAGRPSLCLTLPQVDALRLGALVALFERVVGLYGALIDVNAYDQPGVEAGKRAAVQALALRARLASALSAAPVAPAQLATALSADPVEVFYLLERMVLSGEAGRVQGAYVRGGS